MSSKVIYICDKCRKEFREPLYTIKAESISIFHNGLSFYYVDVCDECYNKIKGETNFSIRKKRNKK
jgi:ribosomal protein L37AE/L43A